MKYLILFLICFNLYGAEKFYKIQVFDANGKQLYGLHAKEADRAKRLADAMKFHKVGVTTLVNIDDSKLFSDRETAKVNAKAERLSILTDIGKIQDANIEKVLRRLAKDFYRK